MRPIPTTVARSLCWLHWWVLPIEYWLTSLIGCLPRNQRSALVDWPLWSLGITRLPLPFCLPNTPGQWTLITPTGCNQYHAAGTSCSWDEAFHNHCCSNLLLISVFIIEYINKPPKFFPPFPLCKNICLETGYVSQSCAIPEVLVCRTETGRQSIHRFL